MKDDFAPFELAVKLKEKGFRELCLAYYDIEDNVGLLYNTQYTGETLPCQYIDLLQSHNTGEAETQSDDSENCVDAPTIPQVLKWLRNTYNLHVETYPCGLGMWKFLVTNITTLEERALCDKYTSSEQAALAGIEYVFDNLI